MANEVGAPCYVCTEFLQQGFLVNWQPLGFPVGLVGRREKDLLYAGCASARRGGSSYPSTFTDKEHCMRDGRKQCLGSDVHDGANVPVANDLFEQRLTADVPPRPAASSREGTKGRDYGASCTIYELAPNLPMRRASSCTQQPCCGKTPK